MSMSQYRGAYNAGRVPSGCLVFQTQHSSWDKETRSSGGFDSAISRNNGKNLWNGFDGMQLAGDEIYRGGTKKVVVLLPPYSMGRTPIQQSQQAAGGVSIYAGHADMVKSGGGAVTTAEQVQYGTMGGPMGMRLVAGANGRYLTNEAYINDLIAKRVGDLSRAAAYRQPIRTPRGRDPDSNWERARRDVQQSRITPFEIHHDTPAGSAGLLMDDYRNRLRNKYISALNSAYGPHPNPGGRSALGFQLSGGALLEVSALTPAILKNSQTISSHVERQSKKIANALDSAQGMEGGGMIARSKSNLPIPNSFTSYDSPENRSSVFILPVMISTPTPSTQTSGVSFPVPIVISSDSIDIERALNSSRGY
jgi:hypothetical protein